MEYLVCLNLFSSHPNKDNTQLISEGGGKSQTYRVNCLSRIPSVDTSHPFYVLRFVDFHNIPIS